MVVGVAHPLQCRGRQWGPAGAAGELGSGRTQLGPNARLRHEELAQRLALGSDEGRHVAAQRIALLAEEGAPLLALGGRAQCGDRVRLGLGTEELLEAPRNHGQLHRRGGVAQYAVRFLQVFPNFGEVRLSRPSTARSRGAAGRRGNAQHARGGVEVLARLPAKRGLAHFDCVPRLELVGLGGALGFGEALVVEVRSKCGANVTDAEA
mmetsp:Transcript_4715/g.13687  ORF Transcript_4715/g.13687 Transcript_4715/m.13687 type:complete len:208 (+) Transcript_4715:2974-3597(+)